MSFSGGSPQKVAHHFELSAAIRLCFNCVFHQGELDASRVERHRDLIRIAHVMHQGLEGFDPLDVVLIIRMREESYVGFRNREPSLRYQVGEPGGMRDGAEFCLLFRGGFTVQYFDELTDFTAKRDVIEEATKRGLLFCHSMFFHGHSRIIRMENLGFLSSNPHVSIPVRVHQAS